jgi:hypothetical protein
MPIDEQQDHNPVVFHSVLRASLVGTDHVEIDEGNREALRVKPGLVLGGRVFYCVRPDGTVFGQELIESSGWPGIDNQLMAAVEAWKFIGERTESVCAYAMLRVP